MVVQMIEIGKTRNRNTLCVATYLAVPTKKLDKASPAYQDVVIGLFMNVVVLRTSAFMALESMVETTQREGRRFVQNKIKIKKEKRSRNH
eukprot:m.165323 g.165323  ORF g.165323 m.165323 type:complete len:90 (+) comp31380_c0_seq1:1096-1365(+)